MRARPQWYWSETTAVLSPSSFVSHAARLRLREGFAADLTAARGDGTMWDLTLAGDRAELLRLQNRKQPEFLAGSLASDGFSYLLTHL